MQMPMTLIHAAYLSLAVMTIASMTVVRCEPEPMARPTRPKVFTTPDELRRYLDLVRDYYSLNGKARYGKRADPYVSQSVSEHPINLLRMLLAIRQKQREQQAKREQLDNEDRSKLKNIHPYNDCAPRYYDVME